MKGGNFIWLMFFGVGLLLLGGGGIIGSAAPFKTDVLAVLVVEETEQLTTELDSTIKAVESATTAAKGSWRRLDKDQSDLSKDEQWVQDAWKVKGATVPWIVAADKRTGINQALPPVAADAVKALSGMGVK